jgi:hypothetical protein
MVKGAVGMVLDENISWSKNENNKEWDPRKPLLEAGWRRMYYLM